MFINRPRIHDLTSDRSDIKKQFRWETINAILYKLGGLVFIVGSILFFPALHEYMDVGAWTFFAGSLLYLVVTLHDLSEVINHWRGPHPGTHHIRHERAMEFTAALTYVTGTLLFTAGSIFFLSEVDMAVPGAWSFVIGSLLFVVGSCINVLQIIKSDTVRILQLMNLTAVTFVVGSTLFTVASIPYLWNVDTTADRRTIDAFLAWQYLIGSTLFFAGGVFNYLRAYEVMRRFTARHTPKS